MNPPASTWRLACARACAWSLLVAGWIGVGSLAFVWAPSVTAGFALVALWLVVLGAAAAGATRTDLSPALRSLALLGSAATAAAGLWLAPRGGGLGAVWLVVLGFGALTALASGVVRRLRIAQRAMPRPPVAAASVGALAAALVLGDIGDVPALSLRLGAFVIAIAAALAALPLGVPLRASAPGCRAGLFDCSLPAWPSGAWRELDQWPTLLAGLAMLPMMAALPLMAAWCRTEHIAAQAMVLLHVAAMFLPAWAWQVLVSRAAAAWVSTSCAALLAIGAVTVTLAPTPWNLLGLALAHGAAWGLAWSAQLWAPARRGQQGTSPLRAALGYALLTLCIGAVVDRLGMGGVSLVHSALGLAAAIAWVLSSWARAATPDASAPTPGPSAAHPDHRAGGR